MRKGLRFFPAGASRTFRRRRILFVLVVTAAAAGFVWPLYEPFARARPQILHLPLSMVWVIFCLLVIFAALLWLYRSERPL